jgi:hypothetical protein
MAVTDPFSEPLMHDSPSSTINCSLVKDTQKHLIAQTVLHDHIVGPAPQTEFPSSLPSSKSPRAVPVQTRTRRYRQGKRPSSKVFSENHHCGRRQIGLESIAVYSAYECRDHHQECPVMVSCPSSSQSSIPFHWCFSREKIDRIRTGCRSVD